jgi:hypothetical protein
MSRNQIYNPSYAKSHALIIGINVYQHAKDLAFACNDATAVAGKLVADFQFPPENVTILKDSDATSANIRKSFMRFTDSTGEDDRVLIFFAGHGYTKKGNRGDVGFLVPHEGSPDELSTLIRWHDLTQSADLFPAKHVLFVMDACYGGLALSRYVHPGSMRFLKDMLQRYSRQVLTAGKADEVVADSGGPRPGHSVFTGHFLDALDGAAAKADGILTANNVMAYVYDKVAKDHHSRQTPHYGPLDGDGDFIFSNLPEEQPGDESNKEDKSIIVSVPPAFAEQQDVPVAKSRVETVKEYLSDSRFRIKLDDLFTTELRTVLFQLGGEDFSPNPKLQNTTTQAEFARRLKEYEASVRQLQGMTTLLGKWAGSEHRHILENTLSRISEINTERNGVPAWIGLRWYPIMLLLYSGGIGALSADRYDNLAAVLTARVGVGHPGQSTQEVILPAVEGMLEVQRFGLFKTIPGHDRNYTPESEYIFLSIQSALEDTLFLGRGYEKLFDRFEVFEALVHADTADRLEKNGLFPMWGPIGRFGWKFKSRRGSQDDPFTQIVLEASRLQDAWPPLQAGLFGGSYARFNEVATGFMDILHKLTWI